MNSNFEYKDEYWKEAEKLIIQEENKKRKTFYFALTLGITSFALIGSFAVITFSKTYNLDYFKPTIKSEFATNKTKNTINFPTKTNSTKSNKNNLNFTSKINDSITKQNDFNSVNNKINSVPNTKKSIPELISNFNSIDEYKNQTDGGNKNLENIFNWQVITLFNKKPNLELNPFVPSPLRTESNSFSPKNNPWKKEVFLGVMMYPSFQNHGIQTNELSFNLGFLVSKKIKGNWNMATGLQYNNYRKLYEFSSSSSYENKNSDLTVSYFSTIEKQTWTPLTNSDSLTYTVQGTTSIVDSGYNIEFLPIYDTVNLSSANPDYLLNIDRKVKEKTVLVGALQIPIEVHYQKNKFRCTAGVATEMYLFNKIKVYENEQIGDYVVVNQQSQINNSFDLLHRFNFNAALGLDYFILNSLSVGFKGTLGLTDLIKNDLNFDNKMNRNNSLNFSLRYHW